MLLLQMWSIFAKFCTHNHTGIWNKGSKFGNDMLPALAKAGLSRQ